LEENRGAIVIPPNILTTPAAPQGNAKVPPNWKPFEFNGATYYMIPLEKGAATTQGSPAAVQGNVTITLPEAKK
jgi:hypothetical protein